MTYFEDSRRGQERFAAATMLVFNSFGPAVLAWETLTGHSLWEGDILVVPLLLAFATASLTFVMFDLSWPDAKRNAWRYATMLTLSVAPAMACFFLEAGGFLRDALMLPATASVKAVAVMQSVQGLGKVAACVAAIFIVARFIAGRPAQGQRLGFAIAATCLPFFAVLCLMYASFTP